jgi:hypothetical protein
LIFVGFDAIGEQLGWRIEYEESRLQFQPIAGVDGSSPSLGFSVRRSVTIIQDSRRFPAALLSSSFSRLFPWTLSSPACLSAGLKI